MIDNTTFTFSILDIPRLQVAPLSVAGGALSFEVGWDAVDGGNRHY